MLTLEGDAQEGEALIGPVMRDGRRTAPALGLDDLRAHAARELDRLPDDFKRLEEGAAYRVEVSPALEALAEEVDARLAQKNP